MAYRLQYLSIRQAQHLANNLEDQGWAVRVVPYSNGEAQVIVDAQKVQVQPATSPTGGG